MCARGEQKKNHGLVSVELGVFERLDIGEKMTSLKEEEFGGHFFSLQPPLRKKSKEIDEHVHFSGRQGRVVQQVMHKVLHPGSLRREERWTARREGPSSIPYSMKTR